ncbi:holin [Yinghuangia aomiensis]
MPALAVCSRPGCGNLTLRGRCTACRRTAEQQRGTARQRGYGTRHERFRTAVLARDPRCVVCGQAPSEHADHWPLSRRQLVERGLNPDDPAHGRGVCQPCHSTETAHNQPGGWNA